MRSDIENYFLHPPADSAAARAAQFGIDLTLTLGNLRLTPEERIRKLDSFIEGIAKLKPLTRLKGPTNATSESLKPSSCLTRASEGRTKTED